MHTLSLDTAGETESNVPEMSAEELQRTIVEDYNKAYIDAYRTVAAEFKVSSSRPLLASRTHVDSCTMLSVIGWASLGAVNGWVSAGDGCDGPARA